MSKIRSIIAGLIALGLGACATVDRRSDMTGASWIGTWSLGGDQQRAITLFESGQAASPSQNTKNGLPGRRGIWRTDGKRAIVTFDDGSTIVMLTKRRSVLWATLADDRSSRFSGSRTAQKVPEPESQFCGVWRLEPQPDGRFLYAVLFADGSAANSIPGSSIGIWSVESDHATIRWKDGWSDILTRTDGGARKESYAPGSEPNDSPVDTTLAVQVGRAPYEVVP